MNLFARLAFVFAISNSLAFAGEEKFTVQVEFYGNSREAGFEAREFEGREWDLQATLNSFYQRNALQWVRTERERARPFVGSTYCARVAAFQDSGAAVSHDERARILGNLLTQLRLRSAEMARARVSYRVTYPSACGDEKRLAAVDRAHPKGAR